MRPVDSLPVVIAGAGLMGRWHAHAAERAGARIVGVVDPRVDRARALRGRRRGCSATGRLADVLEGTRVVHVCSPTETHAALIREALDAGCHVLAEKPLAPHAAAAEALCDRAAAAGVLLCPVYQYPFQDGVLLALARLETIGPLRQIDITIRSAGATGLDNAARDRIASEILPHPMSLLARVPGTDLSRLDWTARHPAPGELRLIGDRSGVGLSVTVSMGGRPPVSTMVLVGASGAIEVDLFHGFVVTRDGSTSRAAKIARPFADAARQVGAAGVNLARRAWRREPAYPGLNRLVERFYDAIARGGPPPISASEALDVARACDQIARAAGLGSSGDREPTSGGA